MKKAVILLSGGLDSTTCLAIAKAEGYACYGLSFDYGQRHSAELDAARRVASYFRISSHRIIDLGQWNGSALTDKSIEVPDYAGSQEIPTTYVPARNTVFLSFALSYAEAIGARNIFIGVSSVDYSHYPDCRPEYIRAFQTLANLATKAGIDGDFFKIHAPLQHLSKADTIRIGIQLGVDYALTLSCYQATENGKACGRCDSCSFRKLGFRVSGIPDPTAYV